MTGEPPFNVLFVCTGNICRSAFAEVLCRQLLADRLGPVAPRLISCSSAGLAAVVGSGMHPQTRELLKMWGPWPFHAARSFVARPLRPHMVRWAELILTAEDDQRIAIAWNEPEATEKLFTMRRFGRIAVALDPKELPGEPAGRARALVHEAAASTEPVDAAADSIPDPVGRPQQAHLRAADLVFEAVAGFVDAVAPLP